MGSFNQSCAVSGLPITPGQSIVAFLLTQSPYEDGNYSDIGLQGQWIARTPILRGEYDDYGRIRSNDTPMMDAWAEAFSLDLVAKDPGKNEHANPAVYRGMSWEDMMRAMRVKRAEVRRGSRSTEYSDEGAPLLLSLCLVRADVWEALVAMKVGGITVAKLRTQLAKGTDWQRHSTQQGKAAIALLRKQSPEMKELFDSIRKIKENMEEIEEQRYCVGELVPYVLGPGVHRTLMRARDLWTAERDEDMVEFKYVAYMLMCIDYQFRPTSHGHQSPEYEAHAAFASAITKIAAKDLVADVEARKEGNDE